MKKTLNKKPLAPLPEVSNNEIDAIESESEQSMNQRKIALAQSGAGPVIISMISDVLQKVPIVGNSEWETLKNAIIIDTSSTVLRDMVDYLEDIKNGSLIGKK